MPLKTIIIPTHYVYTCPKSALVEKKIKNINKQIYRTRTQIENWKTLIQWHNQTLKHMERMNNNIDIPDLVQTFSYVEKGWIKPGCIVN